MPRPLRARILIAVAAIASAGGVAWVGAWVNDKRIDRSLSEASLDTLSRQASQPEWLRDPKVHYWHGVRLAEAGKDREAIAALVLSARLDPKAAPVRHALGVLLEQVGRPADAEVQFKEALRLAPDAAGTHFTLGRIYGKYNRWHDAVDSLEQAHRLDPGDDEATLGLAMACNELALRSNEPLRERARDLLLELRRHRPGDVRVLRQLAGLHVFFNELDLATECYRRVLAIQPADGATRRLLGRTLAEKGISTAEFDEAERLLAQCAAEAPDDPEIVLAQGILAQRRDRTDVAAKLLRRAIALGGTDPEIWFRLGRVLARLGESKAAAAANAVFTKRDRVRRGIRTLETRISFDDAEGRQGPEWERNRVALAKLQLEDRNPKKAAALLNEVLARNPDRADVRALLARCAGAAGGG
ncbi:MAG: tetratricopeptide repeat protein, partial [Armatimonadota bacterium]